MFSLLSAMVFIFISCFIVTFSLTALPPHEPQPSVSDGESMKLYMSPRPPCAAGVFTRMRQVFMWPANLSSRFCAVAVLR